MLGGHLRAIGRLHVIVGTFEDDPDDIERIARSAIQGGADTIQLRRKQGSTRELIEIARRLTAICRARGIPFIVNDRVDVAIAADAHGVHLGADDFPISLARQLLGPDRVIGGSAATHEQAQAASNAGADYVGIAPAFATATKPDAGEPLGPEGVRAIASALEIPAVAIGGITAGNLTELLAAGVRAIALIGAIARANDPEAATREIRAQLDRKPAEL